MLKHLAVVSFILISSGPAWAASDDAWAEFASEVEKSCLAATSDILKDGEAIVDPFGSESYGLAIVSGEAAPGAQRSIICVFDKQSKAVEIGGELDMHATTAQQ
ncbi:hypothetical protein [Devosia sp. FKR38]|uniref:hypothetical protein n=1 Tax=Devosia sp. FKR38 TaxID=2562312 RepID=UPI0010C0390D|nr:hypothetical protein [Devosia sp. FKR38]